MVKPLIFIFRIGFLLYFFLGAWNSINNAEKKQQEFINSYTKFVSTLERRVGVVVPNFLSSKVVEENGLFVVKAIAMTQLGLIGLSLLISNGFTAFLGLVNLVLSCIQLNVASYDLKRGLVDWEPVIISVALFGASLVLSEGGKKRKRERRETDKSQEEKAKKENEKKKEEMTAKRNRRKRD